MCKPASGVFTKGHVAHWSKKSDSHEDIISEFKLCADGVRGPNIVRFEISPNYGDLSLPLDQWKYALDEGQTDLPKWYDPTDGEQAARAMLKDWAACKLTGWNVHEAFHPVNPLLLKRERMTEKRMIELLTQWESVRASVWASVGDSVWASVGDSVGAYVWDSVGDSVRGYIGGLFPNITKWKYAEKLGPDPWRPLLTLWYAGYVPSYDGTTWRLHAGPKADVVLEWTPKENPKENEHDQIGM